jgi:hypothetical protein
MSFSMTMQRKYTENAAFKQLRIADRHHHP